MTTHIIRRWTTDPDRQPIDEAPLCGASRSSTRTCVATWKLYGGRDAAGAEMGICPECEAIASASKVSVTTTRHQRALRLAVAHRILRSVERMQARPDVAANEGLRKELQKVVEFAEALRNDLRAEATKSKEG